jgi:hypothetical protein
VSSKARLISCGARSGFWTASNRKSWIFKYFAGTVSMDRVRQDWIMSTQRREVRFTLAEKICRLGMRLGSWLAKRRDRVEGSENDFPSPSTRNFPASYASRTAPPETPDRVATNSLRLDQRNQQPIRLALLDIRLGSPPLGQASLRRSSGPCSPGFLPIHFPAMTSRFHRTLPWAPAALCRRTERYDGKRNLHFQHAA